MKSKINIILITIAILMCSSAFAQNKNHSLKRIKESYADSLLLEFRNDVYDSFYNLPYVMTKKPVFTMLKIDINNEGKVTKIQFSDSADSLFLKTWNVRIRKHDEAATLGKYAADKNYKNLSLLIPCHFEPTPGDTEQPRFSYSATGSLLKYDGQEFKGSSVIMPSIFIRPGHKEF